MPYYKSGVQVEKNAVYLKLQSKVGLVVMWNGEDGVMVTDSSFRNISVKKMKDMKNSFFLCLCCRLNWTLITSIVHVDFVATSMAWLSLTSSFKMVGSFSCLQADCFIYFTVADV